MKPGGGYPGHGSGCGYRYELFTSTGDEILDWGDPAMTYENRADAIDAAHRFFALGVGMGRVVNARARDGEEKATGLAVVRDKGCEILRVSYGEYLADGDVFRKCKDSEKQ